MGSAAAEQMMVAQAVAWAVREESLVRVPISGPDISCSRPPRAIIRILMPPPKPT